MAEVSTHSWTAVNVANQMPQFQNDTMPKQTINSVLTMDEIMKSVNECNTIRYASYRTASKIQILHRALNMQYVQLDLIAAVFERHRLSMTENTVTLDIYEIEDVLSDIYFATQKDVNVAFDVESTTKLGLDYIFKAFNKKPEDNILVFSVKVALTLISCGRLEEKYGYLFHQLADHNACLSRASLNTLLTNVCKISEMVGEGVAYGNHLIRSSIENCFSESQGCLGATEAEFAGWIMQEPPLLMWISTLNRMKSAEHVVHSIKCSSCKTTPVRGPRYSCLRCAGYHQCQSCFLFGKTSGKHKLKHPVREYCLKATHKEVTKLLIELIRNKLRLCPARNASNFEESSLGINLDQTRGFDTISIRSTIKRRVLNDPQKELQSIITHLEEENRQLQLELHGIADSKVEKLQHHRVAIESQLDRLKVLKNYLFAQSPQVPRDINMLQSTPMVHGGLSRVTALPCMPFELSPIIHQNAEDYINSQSNNSNIDSSTGLAIRDECSTPKGIKHISDSTRMELSTWVGGNRTTFSNRESGFSQWLDPTNNGNKGSENISTDGNLGLPIATSYSPVGAHRDNMTSSLQRSDKHSQHSSLQNIQGDLNDILDRLQNMVANDCLLEDTFSADNNCELKRAATEMEDLLTGLIEGMESRKGKLTTIV